MTAIDAQAIEGRHKKVFRKVQRGREVAVGAIILVALYIVVSLMQFDLGGVARRWDPTKAALFTLDLYAYKDHVSHEWDAFEPKVSFEGGHRFVYEPAPEWLAATDDNGYAVNFDSGIQFVLYQDAAVVKNVPDATQEYEIKRDDQGRPFVVGFQDRPEDLPDWIRATENRVEVRPSLWERMQVYGRKIEIHRYSFGWNYFWFDFASPLANVGPLEAIGLMFDDNQVVRGTPNYELVATEFWNNSLWQHGIIFVALFETLLMAVLGTAIAAMLGLPLAFLAARNVSPFPVIRFINRRLFDLLRGIDMLIWSLIFLRAFGPGLFTGIFAIGFTDTGSLGKLMSEAIENADRKQVDGMKSTGASKMQQHRFGIIPQILPIFVSQSLYFLESNTRSAVIIGAMGAGGIGLQFLGALQTGNDFENVAYMALLILALVIIIDSLSGRLRRALIRPEERHT